MSRCCKKDLAPPFARCTWPALLVLLIYSVTPAFAGPTETPPAKGLIFIDPGHGGNDAGARGIGGTVEKEVALRLSQLISEKLSGKFQVKLSRTDDYDLDAFSRTNMANEAKAALFVSLHAGGSFQRRASGVTVYHFETPAKRVFSMQPPMAQSVDPPDTPEPWRGIQSRHVSASKQLARFFRNNLARFSTGAARVTGADMLMLAGADMPAVLIEVGCLANLAEEKKLQDTDQLAKMAEAIQITIANYFRENSGISSMDLHQ